MCGLGGFEVIVNCFVTPPKDFFWFRVTGSGAEKKKRDVCGWGGSSVSLHAPPKKILPHKTNLETNMSLLNLVFSNEQLQEKVNQTLESTKLSSSVAALILCLYVVFMVVYCGVMAIIHLLSTIHQQTKKEVQGLRLLLEIQNKKLETLEKEHQTLFHAWTHASGQSEITQRLHDTQLTNHANQFADCVKVINIHTATLANHYQVLKNIIQHLHEQNHLLLNTHQEVVKHTEQLEQFEHVVEDLDELSEQVDQTFSEFQVKLEDAIHHFNHSQETMNDKLDEHINVSFCVEEELFSRLERPLTRMAAASDN